MENPDLEPLELKKWHFLRDVPMRDVTSNENEGNEQLRRAAGILRLVTDMSPWPEWCFANVAMCLARDCIVYQSDTDRVGREQIDGYTDPYISPLAPYLRGYDDCDAKARFFVDLCLCRGLPAAMVPRARARKLVHVYGRVYVRGPGQKSARWYLAETILGRARLGEIAEAVPKEIETGKWLF